MAPNFEWQTEEEREAVWAAAEPQQRVRRGRRWSLLLFALLAAVALLFAGYRVWQEVEARADEATAAVREEVRAGFGLLRRAAENGDRELFVTVLSGRDPDWTAAQIDVLEEGVFLERPGMGLRLLPSHTMTVTVSPDLNAAEIGLRQTYVVTDTSGLTQTVRLQQSALFRRGEEQWLYAPPEDAYQFWGPEQKVHGRLLTLSFPQRDEEISRRLAADLEEALAGLCALPHFDCPDGWRLFVHLEPDPRALLQLADSAVPQGAREMALPAPTLVGLPLDEAGYRVLFSGYLGQVVARALSERYSLDDCCPYAPFREALVDWHLARLDLRPSLLAPADYLRLLERTPRVTRLNTVLDAGEEWPAGRLRTRAFAEFVLTGEAGVPPEQVLGSLSAAPEDVAAWFPGRSFRAVARAWRDFLIARVEDAQEAQAGASPVSLPEQDLLLLCGDEAGGDAALVRYDLAQERWLELHTFSGRGLYMSPLPGDQGALFYLVPEGETLGSSVGRTVIWRPEEALILGSVRGEVISPLRGWRREAEDPRGEFVTIFSRSSENGETYWLLSLSECSAGGCDVQEVPGLPIWSPDGSRAAAYDGELHVSAGRAGEDWSTLDGRIAMQGHPAWLGDEAVAYHWSAVWARPVEEGARRKLVDPGDLRPLLPEAGRQATLIVDDFHVHPADPNTLLVVAEHPGADSRVFRMRRPPEGPSFFEEAPSAGEIELLWEFDDPSLQLVDLTPDGRWLIANTFAAGPSFLVFDMTRRQPVFASPNNFPGVGGWDITAGGDWLVHVRAGFIELIALAETEGDGKLYRRYLFPEYDACSGATWLRFPNTGGDETSSRSDDGALSGEVSGAGLNNV